MLVHDFCAPHHHTLTFSLKLHPPVLDEASNGEINDDKLDENDEDDFHRRCLCRCATTTTLSDADYYSFAALEEIVIANWTRGHREVILLFFIKPNRKILEQNFATNRPTTTAKFHTSNEIHFQQFRVDGTSPKEKQDAVTEIDKDGYGAINLNKFADFYHKNKSNGLEIVGLGCICKYFDMYRRQIRIVLLCFSFKIVEKLGNPSKVAVKAMAMIDCYSGIS